MKVIVMIQENELTDPKVFKTPEAVKKEWEENDWIDGDEENFQAMMKALSQPDGSFADSGMWIGWVDVIE